MAINFPTKMDNFIAEKWSEDSAIENYYKSKPHTPPHYISLTGFYVLNYTILTAFIALIIAIGVAL